MISRATAVFSRVNGSQFHRTIGELLIEILSASFGSRPCKTRNLLFLNDFRVNSDGRIS